MFAITHPELDAKPPLGDFILCAMCGKRHRIKYGKQKMDDGTWQETKLLAFYKCGKSNYLAGIKGKDVR